MKEHIHQIVSEIKKDGAVGLYGNGDFGLMQPSYVKRLECFFNGVHSKDHDVDFFWPMVYYNINEKTLGILSYNKGKEIGENITAFISSYQHGVIPFSLVSGDFKVDYDGRLYTFKQKTNRTKIPRKILGINTPFETDCNKMVDIEIPLTMGDIAKKTSNSKEMAYLTTFQMGIRNPSIRGESTRPTSATLQVVSPKNMHDEMSNTINKEDINVFIDVLGGELFGEYFNEIEQIKRRNRCCDKILKPHETRGFRVGERLSIKKEKEI